MAEELPELTVADAEAWQRWLESYDEQSVGVWLVLAKKGTVTPTSLSYAQALEEALCHGWIDGQLRRRDELTYIERFTPRRLRSAWSRNNVDAVARLTAAGRMRPAGVAAVERARADGRWDAAYAGPATRVVPGDLAAALRAQPRAEAMFAILTSQNRFAVLHRIDAARTAPTRSRRIEQFVDMLARGETIYPQKRMLPS